MSIALMTLAWKSKMPSGRKLVLLSLCDNSNDQGECYPSITTIAERCSMSERSVFNHIADLEKDGALVRQTRSGRSTIYQLDPCKFCAPANSAPLQNLHPTPAKFAPPPLQNLHPTPANSAPINIIESSIDPSANLQSKETTASSIFHGGKKNKKVSGKKQDEPVVLPEWMPEELWEAFRETRKSKRAAATPYAEKLLLADLEKFKAEGQDPIAIVQKSIKNSWSAVYRIKEDHGGGGARASPKSDLAEQNKAAMARAKLKIFGNSGEVIENEAR